MKTTRRRYREIADILAREIMEGRYGVGDRLPAERDLAERFGISRPVVREAIIALEIQKLVTVKVGSGVYVTRQRPSNLSGIDLDIGPFELIEARRVVEAETAAFAAASITDGVITELELLIAEMKLEDQQDIPDEDPDRRFHLAIADASGNSGLAAFVHELWRLRESSPMVRRMAEKAHNYGLRPPVEDHIAILDALRARDPSGARQAMRDHLTNVFNAHLRASEAEAVERSRHENEARRRRLSLLDDQ